MTVEIVFVILGTLAMTVSLVEIFGHLFGGLHTLRALTGRMLGRSSEQQSGMDEAMFWVRVAGLFLSGGLALAAGLSVMGA